MVLPSFAHPAGGFTDYAFHGGHVGLLVGRLEGRQVRPSWNWSFDYTEFEQMGAVQVRDVIRFGIPGGAFPRGCFVVWRDGVRIGEYQMDSYPLDWVYGIEIYRHGHDVPMRYRTSFEDFRCGAVLIWSREPGRGRQ